MKKANYEFDKENFSPEYSSIIKVIGVGGGGSNAVNHMYEQGIKGVEFYVCNTDKQSLDISPVSNKIQLGKELTKGLGAGTKPEVGHKAAEESKEEIRKVLENTKMLFITAGMGGGTGTGASPFIAEIAKSMNILIVAIVTKPFNLEGKPKERRAIAGIEKLKKYCDTVIVILNEKVKEIFKDESIGQAFRKTDDILAKASKSIAEIITVPGFINVDFEDVKTVLKDSGVAVMGTSVSEGENRAIKAAQEAINSPLLNEASINNAKYILLSVTVSSLDEFKVEEFQQITDYISEQASGQDTELILGNAIDEDMGKAIGVTIIATGFEEEEKQEILDLENSRKIKSKIESSQAKIFREIRYEDKKTDIPNKDKKERIIYELDELDENYRDKDYKIPRRKQVDREKDPPINEVDRKSVHKNLSFSQLSEEEIKKMQEIPPSERKSFKFRSDHLRKKDTSNKNKD